VDVFTEVDLYVISCSESVGHKLWMCSLLWICRSQAVCVFTVVDM